MSVTLLDLPSKTLETFVPCASCPALQRLERKLAELRREVSELRCDVGYWKSRHADAVKRNERLTEELHQAQGQIRSLQGKLFGRKSEKSATMMASTEGSELVEIEVRAHRRGIRRRRYRATCDCDPARRMLIAPPPPKLIPKGNYGISIWAHVLLDKYSSYRPTERLLGQLRQYDLDLPAGTGNEGRGRVGPLLRPAFHAPPGGDAQ